MVVNVPESTLCGMVSFLFRAQQLVHGSAERGTPRQQRIAIRNDVAVVGVRRIGGVIPECGDIPATRTKHESHLFQVPKVLIIFKAVP